MEPSPRCVFLSSTKLPTLALAPMRLSGRMWAKGPTVARRAHHALPQQAVIEDLGVGADLGVHQAHEGTDARAPARTTVRPSRNV